MRRKGELNLVIIHDHGYFVDTVNLSFRQMFKK